MKLGFIGAGNMGGAMMRGIIAKGILKGNEIIASDPVKENVQKLNKECGITAGKNNPDTVKKSDIVVLSIKPQYYEEAIHEIASHIKAEQIIVTIAPGKTLEWLTGQFGKPVKLVRAMPNTPAMVGEGITGICRSDNVTDAELEMIREIMSGFGIVEVIPEKLMDAVVAVSGSSPAFVFMFIESLADGAVAEGMPRAQAYRFAAQAVLGSAKMVLETGKHPAELKDMVCSPGGTTIDAVRTLEEYGFRSAVEEAVAVCAEKSRSM